MVLPKIDANIELSMANIPYVELSKTVNLNVFDLLKNDYLVTTVEGLENIENIFGDKNDR